MSRYVWQGRKADMLETHWHGGLIWPVIYFCWGFDKISYKATERSMFYFGSWCEGIVHHGLDGTELAWQKDHWIAFINRKHGWMLLLSSTSCFCSAQDPRSQKGDAHTSGGTSYQNVNSLKTSSDVFLKRSSPFWILILTLLYGF